MEFDDWTEDEMRDLAQVYQGVAHPARIGILVAIKSDIDMRQVADFFNMARPSLQDHIDKLIDTNLIYRPEEAERTYELTPLGEYVAARVSLDQAHVPDAVSLIREAEEEIREEIKEDREKVAGTRLPIDEGQLERQIHTEKWDMTWDDIEDLLSKEELAEIKD